LENKLDSKSGLEYRALEEFLDSSDIFKQELYSYLDDADSLKAKNALSLIAGTGDSLLIEPIKRFLTTGKYRTAWLGALGAVKTAESIAILNTWCHSEVERYRYIAARSLLAIGSPEAKAILRNRQVIHPSLYAQWYAISRRTIESR
jgi:HEAT repeat protein